MMRSDKFSDFFHSFPIKWHSAQTKKEKRDEKKGEAENKSVKNGTRMYI